MNPTTVCDTVEKDATWMIAAAAIASGKWIENTANEWRPNRATGDNSGGE